MCRPIQTQTRCLCAALGPEAVPRSSSSLPPAVLTWVACSSSYLTIEKVARSHSARSPQPSQPNCYKPESPTTYSPRVVYPPQHLLFTMTHSEFIRVYDLRTVIRVVSIVVHRAKAFEKSQCFVNHITCASVSLACLACLSMKLCCVLTFFKRSRGAVHVVH